MAVCGKIDLGRARYSQEQPSTVLKRHIMCYIFESIFFDIKYDTEMYVWGIVWDMSGASTGACLAHHLGMSGAFLEHVWWGIIWGMSGACLGQHLGHIVINGQQSGVLHASVMPFLLKLALSLHLTRHLT